MRGAERASNSGMCMPTPSMSEMAQKMPMEAQNMGARLPVPWGLSPSRRYPIKRATW